MKCRKCRVDLEEVQTDYEHGGVLLRGVKALRCPKCGEELFTLEQYGEIKQRLLAVIKPLRLRRKVSEAGKRPAIYLPEDVVRAADVRVGDEIEIYMEGRRIIIEPVKE